ncbi:MAG: T9SS type A sorting domain-containing protein [Bacteroidetes bacterium]|nr:T9SS type A sorting domain-containing protein [Bacteroidota bacterium]
MPKNRNFNITQFYSVAASKAGEILGGAQDNGTNFISLRENSIKASREVSGGDGFDAEISKVNPNFHFYSVYNGKYYRSAKKGEGVSSIVSSDIDGWDGSPSDGEADGVGFFTKFHLLEVLDSSKSFFIGSSTNGRLYICSNALSIEKLKWYRLIIGGEGECFASSTNGDVLYVGKNGGVTRISGFRNAQDQLDVNGTPTALANLSAPVTYNIPGGGTVYGITVDPKDENHIVATLGGFGGVNKVFESFNGGVLFTAKQGNLPVMPCYDAVIDATDAKRVLIASELGMWMTEDITQANPVWVEANKGLGRVPTFKLRQENLYTDGCPVIYAGTHGRGFMRTTSFTPTTCNTIVGKSSNIQNIAFDAKSVKISPNPASDIASIEFSSIAEQKASLVIYNTAGAVVKRENIQVSEGINKYSFNIDQINPGNYFVRIQNANTTLGGAKLIVQ